MGNTTNYVFDNLYRRTDVVLADPDGVGPQTRPTTHIDYDLVNRPISTTDPLGRQTAFQYDDLDRLVREVYPDPDDVGPLTSPEMSYKYDLVGNELSMTDAVNGVLSYQLRTRQKSCKPVSRAVGCWIASGRLAMQMIELFLSGVSTVVEILLAVREFKKTDIEFV